MKHLSSQETQAHIAALGIEAPVLEAFTYLDSADDVVYDWHAHPHHQLLYAYAGTLRLEAHNHLYLLPPQRAVWIPAGVMHRTTLNKVRSGSVFLLPALVPTTINRVRVIAAAPIVREMLLFAMRWSQHRAPDDALANAYFHALGLLCAEWLMQEMPFHLPVAQTPSLLAAIDFTLTHLDSVDLEQVARVANYSPRHFSRRFKLETGLEWRQFRLHARLLRAMELLIEPRVQITQVAYAVGFNSLSAFAKAFSLFVGESPSAYRVRNHLSASLSLIP